LRIQELSDFVKRSKKQFKESSLLTHTNNYSGR
jgi:hypothetical protein